MYDVIIVGLGAMGSATAWQASRLGARVLGLDRHRPPHRQGSSHGETRLTRLALGEGAAYAPLAIRSHAIWRELEAITRQKLFQPNGLLIFGAADGESLMHGNRRFLETTIEVAQAYDIPHDCLDAAAMRQRFPQFRIGPHDRGFYEPGAGMLFPERCVATQLRLARALGADLRLGETVLDLAETASGGVRVTTTAGRYEAASVVLSAGAWLREFLPAALRDRFRICRQVLGWYAAAHEPARHMAATMPNFVRLPAAGEELVYGFPQVDPASPGLKVASEQFHDSCDPATVVRQVDASEMAGLQRIASRAVDLQPDCRQALACLYTVTPDSHFVIDRHPDIPGVIIVSPCSGHGFKHSAAIGECVAALANDRDLTLDLSPFRLDRLDTQPFTTPTGEPPCDS